MVRSLWASERQFEWSSWQDPGNEVAGCCAVIDASVPLSESRYETDFFSKQGRAPIVWRLTDRTVPRQIKAIIAKYRGSIEWLLSETEGGGYGEANMAAEET